MIAAYEEKTHVQRQFSASISIFHPKNVEHAGPALNAGTDRNPNVPISADLFHRQNVAASVANELKRKGKIFYFVLFRQTA